MAVNATRIRSFAPQFLVDDLETAIKFYSEILGFSFGPTWRGFYAIGERDGFEVYLKCAPKAVEDRVNRRQHQHLDIYASVIGVDALYAACKAKGATILKPLDRTARGTNDFYLEDPGVHNCLRRTREFNDPLRTDRSLSWWGRSFAELMIVRSAMG